MSRTLSYIDRKANKDHKCDFCGGTIKKGTIYERQGILFDDSIYTWKSHLVCNKICYKLNMRDNSNDGVTSEDFQEYINSEYYKLLNENVEIEKRSFLDRLEIVCANYLNDK